MLSKIKLTKENTFLIFLCIGAFSFIIGLVVCNLIPQSTKVFTIAKERMLELISQEKQDSIFLSIKNAAYAYSAELKYLLIIFCAGFSNFSIKIFSFIIPFKCLLVGFSSACLLRMAKYGDISLSFLGFSAYIILSVALIATICKYCSDTFEFSTKRKYPLKFKQIIKRKTTYMFLMDFCVWSGICFLISYLKLGIFVFMIS